MARPPIGVPYDWPAELDEILGVVSDNKLSGALGIHISTVAARRRKLGIQPYRIPGPATKVVTCVICGREFRTLARKSIARTTCPPTPPDVVSRCQVKLANKTFHARPERTPSLAKQLKNIPGWKMTDGLDE